MTKTNIYTKLLEVKKVWIKLQRDTEAFNYKYATLSQIQEKFSDVLQDQKLVVVHKVQSWCVITAIVDTESERAIESSIEMNTTKAQDKWSEITYYRRYNLLSLLDLEVEDDDWKKAQDSVVKDKKDNKEWFTETNLQNMKNNIDTLKKTCKTWADLVIEARKNYKVNKEFAGKIEALIK